MTRFLAMGVLAFALTGCGTVRNFQDSETGTQPYGGVKIALHRFNGNGDATDALPAALPIPEELHPLVWPIDVPLCFVADTLTLPLAIPLAIHGGYMDYYFPKPGSPRNPQLPQWLADSQPTLHVSPPITPAP